MAEPLQLGVMPMPRNLIAHKVLDALERGGFIGPRRPHVPAWKAKAGRYDSSEDEDDDDVSTAGCSSKMGISTEYARVEALAGNQALFGLVSEDGDGGMGIEENFFRGPIALEALNRKEAGLLRRSLQRLRAASSDISDGEDPEKMTQKVFYYVVVAYFCREILIFLACSGTKVRQFLDGK